MNLSHPSRVQVQVKRLLSTSACSLRPPTTASPSRPSTFTPPAWASSSPYYPGSPSSGNVGQLLKRPFKGNKWKPRATQPARGAPSSISAAQVQLKLVEHLSTRWARDDRNVSRLAHDLGIDFHRFAKLAAQFSRDNLRAIENRKHSWDLDALQVAYVTGGQASLEQLVLAGFVRWAAATQPLPPIDAEPDPALAKLHHLARLTDLRFPGEDYPLARQQRRTLILHVGPTNSGKTHAALVALARARTGCYAGPLRLLAHEVFSRFNEGKIGDEGKRVCNLVTGEEQKILDPFGGLSSCTVEMFPLGQQLDVGVIDEIQMIGDSQRGTAWTNAVIGSQCTTLHLCGEESVVDLVQNIARDLGDTCIVKRYSRLSPLAVAPESLHSDLSKIKRGDCLVTFSRNNIFAFKRVVEEKTGLRVAVAYGGLPPEVREEQARAFNEGQYDVLVASDAVGMGLNLKIKRIVFETLHKWDGKAEVTLSMPQIKQIAGRAGRYGVHSSPTAPDDADAVLNTTAGVVTTLDESDMDLLRAAIISPIVQVTQAVLQPPRTTFRGVQQLLPSTTPLSKVNEIVLALAHTSPLYSPVASVAPASVTDALEHVRPLSFAERTTLSSSPVNARDPKAVGALVGFAELFSKGEPIIIDDWAAQAGLTRALQKVEDAASAPSLDEVAATAPKAVGTVGTLQNLESFHRSLTLYLWLSYRLPVGFVDHANARTMRKKVERAIDLTLAGLRFERKERKSKQLLNANPGYAPGSDAGSQGAKPVRKRQNLR
ncbi:hypothetical protein RQP46_001076 [Phenoliferia psychrophenolica]